MTGIGRLDNDWEILEERRNVDSVKRTLDEDGWMWKRQGKRVGDVILEVKILHDDGEGPEDGDFSLTDRKITQDR